MLKDKFSRKHNYLRVSVTDKCNLRCTYCMPSNGVKLLKHDEVLRNEEFVYFIEIFARLGVEKIRFTGGEPLLRKGFIDIVEKVRDQFPDLELCITTNGILLDNVLEELLKYRVRKINISLDSMSSNRFKAITSSDEFDKLISNIDKVINKDFFDVKINTVLFNETLDELDDFLEYFKERNVTLRFIERMPFIEDPQNQKQPAYNNLIYELEKRGELTREVSKDTRVAKMFNLKYKCNDNIKIGIIPPISHCFCSECNRLRLTCDGFLRTCLHSNNEVDLKNSYRMDMGSEVIERLILKAIKAKPEKHNLDCNSAGNDGCASFALNRTMSGIGG